MGLPRTFVKLGSENKFPPKLIEDVIVGKEVLEGRKHCPIG